MTRPTTDPGDPEGGLPLDGGMRMLAELEDVARTERSRLADALHDDALQLMAVARQDLLEWMDDTPARAAIERRLVEMLGALRSVIGSIDEPTLDDLPLRASVERLAESITRRARFVASVRTEGDVDGIHDAAVRGWARELLVNVVKHASATSASVLISATPEDVEVVVTDDGAGFDGAEVRRATEAGHVGLRRLERAAHLLGGEFVIRRDGGLTVARVRMPRAALVAQRRTEDDLGAERRWSAGLVAALRDALLVVREGRVVQVNEVLVELTGFAADEIVGTVDPTFPFWDREHRDENARLFAHALSHGGGRVTVCMTRADGGRFNAEWAVQRIDDGMGGGIGSLVIVRDLSEQERAHDRAQLRTELEATIETTRRLARILDAARRGPVPMFDALGELLTDHLGWEDVVLNVRRGEHWVVEWTSAGDAEVLRGERYTDDAFAMLLHPRFDRGGVFYSLEEDDVDIEDLVVVQAARPTGRPDGVRAGDTLMLPVADGHGRPRAIVSVDRPRTGLRPTSTQLAALAAIASHVGLAFELLDGQG